MGQEEFKRISVVVKPETMEISVRVLRNPYVIVPLVLGAIIWLFGLFFLIDKVFNSYQRFIEMGIAGMLIFWLVPGFAVFSTLYWIYFMKEKIIVSKNFLQTEKPVHIYKRKHVYEIDDVKNIRVDKEIFKVKRNGVWIDDIRTVIKFETSYKQIVFGRGLTEKEAEHVYLELAKSEFLKESQFNVTSLN